MAQPPQVPMDSLVTELRNLTPLETAILERLIPAVRQAAVDLPVNAVQDQRELDTTGGRHEGPQGETDRSGPRVLASSATQSVNQIQQRIKGVEENQEALQKQQRNLDKFTTKVGMIFRGVPLILIVLAVIGYPLYAMIFNINAEDLAQYIAPVTGLAGAIIGYWFGQAGQLSASSQGTQST